MRPERFYTVGRSAGRRTDRPIIIIPKLEPPTIIVPPTPAAPSQASSSRIRNFWSRFWSIAKIFGPAIVAVIALVVSFLAYTDQHKANEAAAISNQRHQAELVSFVQQSGTSTNTTTILIDNNSESPVENAQLNTDFVSSKAKNAFHVNVHLGAIPACSIGHITGSMIVDYIENYIGLNTFSSIPDVPAKQLANTYQFIVSSMYFTDSNGATWQYSESNPLESIPLLALIGSITSIASDEFSRFPFQISYQQAGSCS